MLPCSHHPVSALDTCGHGHPASGPGGVGCRHGVKASCCGESCTRCLPRSLEFLQRQLLQSCWDPTHSPMTCVLSHKALGVSSEHPPTAGLFPLKARDGRPVPSPVGVPLPAHCPVAEGGWETLGASQVWVDPGRHRPSAQTPPGYRVHWGPPGESGLSGSGRQLMPVPSSPAGHPGGPCELATTQTVPTLCWLFLEMAF